MKPADAIIYEAPAGRVRMIVDRTGIGVDATASVTFVDRSGVAREEPALMVLLGGIMTLGDHRVDRSEVGLLLPMAEAASLVDAVYWAAESVGLADELVDAVAHATTLRTRVAREREQLGHTE